MVPLLCGSALKNKGVQPLLDSVLKYLPDPSKTICTGVDPLTQKRISRKPDPKAKLCALAFKVVNDKEKGMVTFFRVY
jgi:elongation factor G